METFKWLVQGAHLELEGLLLKTSLLGPNTNALHNTSLIKLVLSFECDLKSLEKRLGSSFKFSCICHSK